MSGIPSAEDFLKMLKPDQAAAVFAFGAIDSAYTLGRPKVLFDGETTISGKAYPYLSSYNPVSGDRVIMACVGGGYVILGKIV